MSAGRKQRSGLEANRVSLSLRQAESFGIGVILVMSRGVQRGKGRPQAVHPKKNCWCFPSGHSLFTNQYLFTNICGALPAQPWGVNGHPLPYAYARGVAMRGGAAHPKSLK
jgi:hypothetical protein